MAKRKHPTLPIEFGPAHPKEADIVFASIDADGNPGDLNRHAFESLGITEPDYPSPEKLSEGFAVVQYEGKPPVVLVATVHPDLWVGDVLTSNLKKALESLHGKFRAPILWIPLMGTGEGGLSLEESLIATLDTIYESNLQSIKLGDIDIGTAPERILLATPPDMSSEDFETLRAIFEEETARLAETKPAGEDEEETDVRPPSQRPADLAPFYPDHPAHEDSLGRKAVAEAIATIIREVFEEPEPAADSKTGASAASPDRDRTFMVHIHGKWGAGKTSILNFLKDDLQSGDGAKRWVVVDYNAWRNQKNGPAWWTLLTEVYRQAVAQLQTMQPAIARKVRNSERLWRFRSGWAPYIIAFALLLWAITVAFAFSGAEFKEFKDVLTVLATVFTLWGGISAFGRTTRLGSSRTASTFLELSRDPLRPLTRHYEELVREIGHPVAVFVDDLDRADADFVVELIQTIQTLFRKAPVAYVVAADRNWICTSYEKAYDDFKGTIREPGRPLGHLFLEKIFQLSISVPVLSKRLQAAYWDRLLMGRPTEQADVDTLRREQQQKMSELKTDTEVRAHLDAITNPVERRVAGTVAFQRLQSKDLRKKREHFLQAYAELLEPNPRAMKRLLNTYGFRLGFEMMADISSPPDTLVRWTVLELRWPLLAEHLVKHAEQIENLLNGAVPEGINGELVELFDSEAVRTVARGLDSTTVRKLTAAETGGLPGQAAAA
ncbi:MAG: P-loop NTPase fold protein [Alphaproteobacteria bacterium]|nr:P-loop NTPase fold protein [Alphaproteobacteria bacterium]